MPFVNDFKGLEGRVFKESGQSYVFTYAVIEDALEHFKYKHIEDYSVIVSGQVYLFFFYNLTIDDGLIRYTTELKHMKPMHYRDLTRDEAEILAYYEIERKHKEFLVSAFVKALDCAIKDSKEA